jgi:glycerophosphoryl diester phosphodiesterase
MFLKITKILLSISSILVLVYALLAWTSHSAAHHPFFMKSKRPLLIAHRGGAGLWPENTMYAFKKAVELGVDALEMDVHSTADGELIVIHDTTLDRTTNGKGSISSLKYAELQKLDAGYNWTNDNGRTFPFRGQGIVIPRLEEVFLAFPEMKFNIEIKPRDSSLAKPLCQLIHKHGMSNRVLIASFSDEAISSFRKECGDVATSGSATETLKFFTLNRLYLDAVYSPDAYALQVPEKKGNQEVVTKSFLEAAHSRNLAVYAWTINDVETAKRMLALGVDGILTDYPDRLKPLFIQDQISK